MGAAEHEFDFWLGDWDVHDADGKLVGRNTISRAVATRACARSGAAKVA